MRSLTATRSRSPRARASSAAGWVSPNIRRLNCSARTSRRLIAPQNHDLFGLAVLIFHLLMMGRHPFSGVPMTQADIPIEKAIRDGCYAYTRNTATARLRPPPHVPPATMLDQAVLDLFDRSFCTPRRPTATEWRASLDAAMKQIVRCKIDPKHAHLPAAGKCPWCELIAVARLMFFLPSQGAAVAAFKPEDIQQLLQKLAGMALTFASYTRPTPLSPIAASLPAGLRSVKKPAPLLTRLGHRFRSPRSRRCHWHPRWCRSLR